MPGNVSYEEEEEAKFSNAVHINFGCKFAFSAVETNEYEEKQVQMRFALQLGIVAGSNAMAMARPLNAHSGQQMAHNSMHDGSIFCGPLICFFMLQFKIHTYTYFHSRFMA